MAMLALVPGHHHGLQKRLSPTLYVIVIALHRPNTLSKCIKGKACAPLGSNSRYNEFALAISGAAFRSVTPTPVKAVPEVAILTGKTA